jgi:hypothetical protein
MKNKLRTLLGFLHAASTLLVLVSCSSENLLPSQQQTKGQAYTLLKSKLETTTYGRSVFTNLVTYEYDTSSVPKLKKELNGQTLTTYSYPSEEAVELSYSDKDTKKILNKVKYTLNKTTKNVLKVSYDDGSVYLYEYDALGYLTKDSFDPNSLFTYQSGNLSAKNSQTTNTAYNQSYNYTSSENKPYWFPFFFGKADKNLADVVATTTSVDGKSTTLTTNISYTFDKNGYILSQKQELYNGAYIETKFEYQTIKR